MDVVRWAEECWVDGVMMSCHGHVWLSIVRSFLSLAWMDGRFGLWLWLCCSRLGSLMVDGMGVCMNEWETNDLDGEGDMASVGRMDVMQTEGGR